jgi:hypothetical protein
LEKQEKEKDEMRNELNLHSVMTLLTPEWKEKRRRRNAHMLTFFQRNNIACGTGVAGGRDVASCCCIDCRRHQVGRVIGDGSPLTPFGQEIHVRCS